MYTYLYRRPRSSCSLHERASWYRPGSAHPLLRAPRLVSVPHLIIVPLTDSLPPSTSTINSAFAVIRRQHDYSQRPGRSPDVRR